MKKKIKDFIEKNEIEKAIQTIKDNLPSSKFLNELISIESRWNRIEKKERLAIVSFSEANTEKNQIVKALIDITDKSQNLKLFSNSTEFSLLQKAANSSSGIIRHFSTKDGWTIQSDDKIIAQNVSLIDQLKWKNIISLLCQKGLVKGLIIKPNAESYQITVKGFDLIGNGL